MSAVMKGVLKKAVEKETFHRNLEPLLTNFLQRPWDEISNRFFGHINIWDNEILTVIFKLQCII